MLPKLMFPGVEKGALFVAALQGISDNVEVVAFWAQHVLLLQRVSGKGNTCWKPSFSKASTGSCYMHGCICDHCFPESRVTSSPHEVHHNPNSVRSILGLLIASVLHMVPISHSGFRVLISTLP